MNMSEKETVGWIYQQLRSSPNKQPDLCAAFHREFGRPENELLDFIVGSKYFRKTGSEGNWVWEVSANRLDDLRDYLAD